MLYQEVNDILISANVLPELKSTSPVPRRRDIAPAAITPGAAINAEADSTQAASTAQLQVAFSELQSMLSQLRGTALPARNIPADAVPISSNDLMRLLSHMQQHLPNQSAQDQDLREQLDKLPTDASQR